MATFSTILTTLAVVALSTIGIVNCLHYPQFFQSFPMQACLGEPTNLLETNANITDQDDPAIRQPIAVTSRGLWRIVSDGLFMVSGFSHGAWSCGHLGTNGVPVPMNMISATKIVPSDMDDSVLALLSWNLWDSRLLGTTKVVNTAEASFDTPFEAQSWAFTGAESYTLYSERDYKGNATCAQVGPTSAAKGWGLTQGRPVTPIRVGSVRRGCAPRSQAIASTVNYIQGNDNAEKPWIAQDRNGKEVEGFFQAMPGTKIF